MKLGEAGEAFFVQEIESEEEVSIAVTKLDLLRLEFSMLLQWLKYIKTECGFFFVLLIASNMCER